MYIYDRKPYNEGKLDVENFSDPQDFPLSYCNPGKLGQSTVGFTGLIYSQDVSTSCLRNLSVQRDTQKDLEEETNLGMLERLASFFDLCG